LGVIHSFDKKALCYVLLCEIIKTVRSNKYLVVLLQTKIRKLISRARQIIWQRKKRQQRRERSEHSLR